MGPLMTTKDVAQFRRVSEDSVRAYERKGTLPATRTTSGVRLFDPQDVAKLAAERADKAEKRG